MGLWSDLFIVAVWLHHGCPLSTVMFSCTGCHGCVPSEEGLGLGGDTYAFFVHDIVFLAYCRMTSSTWKLCGQNANKHQRSGPLSEGGSPSWGKEISLCASSYMKLHDSLGLDVMEKNGRMLKMYFWCRNIVVKRIWCAHRQRCIVSVHLFMTTTIMTTTPIMIIIQTRVTFQSRWLQISPTCP